ncbi:CheY-like chemotaxis protein [Brevundimonas alba]|uniref:CheY-like chemotaxis protein n=1 Tax=Brevundimonas alba TaxID=74314 RepID=A0A7X5YKP2_9CAUL|nr:response regulator [Brevundimonas alba]NJC41682.1 CheY-like chemotaxis protein [Brevundimonas alba]
MLKILHVDDEPDIREVAALSLEMDPEVEVRSAASGDEALEILGGGLRPDVILLDVMMPRLDGPGTLAQLRELTGLEATPVIFMTARAQAHEHGRFIDLGAIGVIVKPFDPMTLARQVRDLLAQERP